MRKYGKSRTDPVHGLKVEILNKPSAWKTVGWTVVENDIYIVYAGELRNDEGTATEFSINLKFTGQDDHKIKSIDDKSFDPPVADHTKNEVKVKASEMKTVDFTLVDGSEQEVSGKVIFSSLEILIPEVGEDGAETGEFIATKKLKVGKMEGLGVLSASDNLTINNDIDRFYVRILGGNNLGQSTFTLKTNQDANYVGPGLNYSNPEVKIDFETAEDDLKSKSLLLVADTVDDANPNTEVGQDNVENDRSQIINLGGDVQITKVEANGTTFTFGNWKIKAPPRKKISGKIFIMGTDQFPISATKVAAHRDVMRERFAQVGIRADITFANAPLPADVNPGNIQIKDPNEMIAVPGGGGVFAMLKNDAKVIIDSVRGEQGLPKVAIFVVPKIALPNEAGIAIMPFRTHPDDSAYKNVVFVNAELMDGKPFTTAHEVLHILTNAGHYGVEYPSGSAQPPTAQVAQNLMREGTSASNTVGASKRLTKAQETMINAHGLVENP